MSLRSVVQLSSCNHSNIPSFIYSLPHACVHPFIHAFIPVRIHLFFHEHCMLQSTGAPRQAGNSPGCTTMSRHVVARILQPLRQRSCSKLTTFDKSSLPHAHEACEHVSQDLLSRWRACNEAAVHWNARVRKLAQGKRHSLAGAIESVSGSEICCALPKITTIRVAIQPNL